MRTWFVLCVALAAAACSAFVGARMEQFEATARAYEHALRWSDFNGALGVTGNPAIVPADPSRLHYIRVTAYDVIRTPQADENAMTYKQAVEIRYVNTNNMSERVYVDQQTWEYSEKEQRWILTSPFPSFR